jgi:phosphotransferase system HPr (HPr) family protein
MRRKVFKIENKYGIHLRPAVKIFEAIRDLRARVEIKKGDAVADARSTLGIILLNITSGDTIEVIADGVDEDLVIERLTDLIEVRKFDEDKE